MPYSVLMLFVCCLAVTVAVAADGFSTTSQGARYLELTAGSGQVVETGDIVTMHFTGWLDDNGRKGRRLYNTRSEGRPVSFVVGTERVMPGWSDGVIGMRPGGKRLLMLPPHLAFGDRAVEGIIPPRASLIFVIDVIVLEKARP